MIEIFSEKLTKGQANLNDHPFGKGLIVDAGNKSADLEWEFYSPRDGLHVLHGYYASNDCRPVSLSLNGKNISEDALSKSTGGYYLADVRKQKVGEVFIKKGVNTLKLTTDHFMPHIAKFTLESRNHIRNYVRHRLESAFLINPYRVTHPNLFRKFMHHGLLFGFQKAIFKAMDYLNPKDFLSRNLADVLGIYSGEFAYTGPKLVQIDITNNCNNDCVGCWCHSTYLEEKQMPAAQKRKFIPFDKMVEILDELRTMGCREIYYAGGGDPSTHPRFMEILEKTKQNGFIAYVNTNFTLFSKDMIRKCVEIGLDHFTLSVWAGSEKSYLSTHPNKKTGDFEKLKESISFLNKLKRGPPYTKIYNVISSRNYYDLKSMIQFAQDTNSDSIEFTMADIVGGKTEFLLLEPDQLKVLQRDASDILESFNLGKYGSRLHLFRYNEFLRRIQDDHDTLSGEYDKNIVSKLPCTIGWTFSRINADGTVNGCLKSHRIPVGNIHEHSFNRIWNGDKQQWFRRHSLAMKQGDNFFRMIGNDSGCEMGCIKSCDDIGRNQAMKEKMDAISLPVKAGLKLWSFTRFFKNYNDVSPVHSGSSVDPRLKGYKHGSVAYKGPRLTVIDLTNFCASQCVTCFTKSPLLGAMKPDDSWFKHKLDRQKLESVLNQLANGGLERVRFTGGGDPLFYKGIEDVVAICKALKLSVSITTNLYGVNEKILMKCLEAGLDELAVSLMSATAENYLITHPGCRNDGFSEVLDLIKKSRQFQHVRISLAHVIHKHNYKQLIQMYELGISLGVDAVYFAALDTINGRLNSIELSETEIYEVLDQCAKIEVIQHKQYKLQLEGISVFKIKLKNRLQKAQAVAPKMPPCSVGWHFSRITADGNVLPCCRGTHKPMGNINQSDFESVWQGPSYSEFRTKSRNIDSHKDYFKAFECATLCDNTDHNQQFYDEYLK